MISAFSKDVRFVLN